MDSETITVGKVYKSNNCGEYKVISYNGQKCIGVEFIDTGYKTMIQSGQLIKGTVKDKLYPSVYGFGFIGDGLYEPRENGKVTKSYETWCGMIRRCYSLKSLRRNPTYHDVFVCDEWANFQSFAEWFNGNYIEGFELDKDIKNKGNKTYSPDGCSFVSHAENVVQASAKYCEFISPEGVPVGVYNLAEFCAENCLTDAAMSRVYSGKRPYHKGWSKAIGAISVISNGQHSVFIGDELTSPAQQAILFLQELDYLEAEF